MSKVLALLVLHAVGKVFELLALHAVVKVLALLALHAVGKVLYCVNLHTLICTVLIYTRALPLCKQCTCVQTWT